MEESKYPDIMTKINTYDISQLQGNGDYIELLKTIIGKSKIP